MYVFIIYIYIYNICKYIGKSDTYASHQACFLCSSALHAGFGSFASKCKAAKSDFMHTWVFAWQHGGKCIAFATACAWYAQSYALTSYRRLHKCNAEVQNVP